VYRNSMVRKLQVNKMRGGKTRPGLHGFRITDDGLKVFAMIEVRPSERGRVESRRVTMGVPHLDDMLGGGLPVGYSLLIAGPSGAGKTVLAKQFLVEGARRGENGVLVAFEQTPSQSLDPTLDALVRSGTLGLINTRALDLSIDEVVSELLDLITRKHATRVVIDSLSGFELAIAPTFREDFRESLFRMVSALAVLGVTVVLTSELEDRYTDLRFSPYGSAFLTDAIIVQRYIELEGRLARVMAVVKVRASLHSSDLRRFEIDGTGLVIGERIVAFEGLLGGQPSRASGGKS